MRLLVVMSHNPFPPRTGSTMVAFNTIKHLSPYHAIDFICLKPPEEPAEPPEFLKTYEFVCQRHVSWFGGIWRKVFYMLLGVPFSVSKLKSKEMNERVREVIEHGTFDAILLFDMRAIQYCPPSSYRKVVVNVEDPASIRLHRIIELPIWSLWQKLRILFVAKITSIYETNTLPKMGKVLLLSEADMRDMQEQAGYDNLGFVPYGVDQICEHNILSYKERADGMIVFSGNMFHPPNVDGALHFLQNIFPVVLNEYPTAVLWIVGADPDIRVREKALSFGEHVVVTGRVTDVLEYVGRAVVSVCPNRLNTGQQTKILEALSCGTPVVTTSAGNSAILGRSSREMWIEDDSNMFARRVGALLRGEDWHRLSEQGRKLAVECFSWEQSAKALEQHIIGIQTTID
jgi:glycosyltransferase involved in cell wall biosynthesis